MVFRWFCHGVLKICSHFTLAAQLVTSAAFVERAMAETLKVAIIGAGLGGLTLAKTLLQPEPGSRPVEVCGQGETLRIDVLSSWFVSHDV